MQLTLIDQRIATQEKTLREVEVYAGKAAEGALSKQAKANLVRGSFKDLNKGHHTGGLGSVGPAVRDDGKAVSVSVHSTSVSVGHASVSTHTLVH